MDREARMNLHCGWRVPVVVLLLLGVAGLDAFAQVPTGTIAGTVKDSQGLSIPGATVLLTNEGTARTQAAKRSPAAREILCGRGFFKFFCRHAEGVMPRYFLNMELKRPRCR